MAVALSYPGVYIQEAASGVRTITGVGTSTALFIGRTGKGPLNDPIRCLTLSDFLRNFSDDVSVGDMARYVSLFFQNGGTDCYVVRIANGALPSEVVLLNEGQNPVLKLIARHRGSGGESIRAEVSYRGPHPEARFNIRLFRWAVDHRGQSVQQDEEELKGLSMDPNSPQYAIDLLNQQSNLVTAEDLAALNNVPVVGIGYSLSGRPMPYDKTEEDDSVFIQAWGSLTHSTTSSNALEISVDGSAFATVDFSHINVTGMSSVNKLADAIKAEIDKELPTVGASTTSVAVTFVPGPDPDPSVADQSSRLLRIESRNKGDVFVRPARPNDAAVRLMLGAEQGGLEVGAHATLRPAPSGLSLRVDNTNLVAFAGMQQVALAQPSIDGAQPVPGPFSLQTTANTGDPAYLDGFPPSPTGNNDGVREKLALMRDGINHDSSFPWCAELWGHRLVLIPKGGGDNRTATTMTVNGWTDITCNLRRYSLGVSGLGNYYQVPADIPGNDGIAPRKTDYAEAYRFVEKEVDLFNLLVLPPDREPAVPMQHLWPEASTFCAQQRAFLLMDPPDTWTDAQQASEGVAALRAGLVNDHSAVFFPKLLVNEGGRQVKVGPAGAIAGLMARIDSARGVWKAPAGLEASLRGVLGVEYRFSDRENGVLNPRGINTIRLFPSGIVNWGARTMDGDDDFASEWKYIPIRRLALYIEESLYRGTQWVVFEPNDEPLWSQIRLNVGAFMNNLFRQGAFQGATARDAYFVKCDSETTTQNDIDLGIVNIWVGFAPLKPAEFVVVTIRQMAGQIQA